MSEAVNNVKSVKSWTKAQQTAIKSRETNLLLSAAAGSGKTATLTERIIRMVTNEEFEISRLLVVTFTKAAASELKDRIMSALQRKLEENPEDRRLARQINDLYRADISTIHSFCLKVIRPRAAKFGLPLDFRVADSTEINIIKENAVRDTVSKYFDTMDTNEEIFPGKITDKAWSFELGSEVNEINGIKWDSFCRLADALSGERDEESLDKILLELFNKMAEKGITPSELKNYCVSLRKWADKDFYVSDYGMIQKEYIIDFAKHFQKLFYKLSEKTDMDGAASYSAAAFNEAEFCSELIKKADEGYSSLRQTVLSWEPCPIGRMKSAEQTENTLYFKEMRSVFREKMKKLRERYFASEESDIREIMLRTADIVESLSQIAHDFFLRFGEEKREAGIVDFSDLEGMCASVLADDNQKPTEDAREIASMYDCIFIDEYQDTNYTQDLIFRMIGCGTVRYMVGDIKQSIYGFRGAEPEVFNNYRESFSKDDCGIFSSDSGQALFMSENFRSSRSVVDFVNTISGYVFKYSDIKYEKEDELMAAREGAGTERVFEPEILLSDKSSGVSEEETVAKRIYDLHTNEGVALSDIAVLLRAVGEGKAEKYARALEKLGINTRRNDVSSFFEQSETLLLIALFTSIDNPSKDIYLAAAMKSPIFNFTLDELVKIKKAHTKMSLWDCVKCYHETDELSAWHDAVLSEKCIEFIKKMELWRDISYGLSADRFILFIYRETSVEALLAGGERPAELVVSNLNTFYEMAREYESQRFGGLCGFVKYINSAAEKGSAAKGEMPSSDAVAIMSIHQSKGLEFPVCILAETAKRRNEADEKSNLIFDKKLGVCMRLYDPSGFVRCDNALRLSGTIRMRNCNIYEEMRILYVALTRARDRIIVSADVRDISGHVNEAIAGIGYESKYSVINAPNYITWISSAYASRYGENSFKNIIKCCVRDGDVIKALPFMELYFGGNGMSDIQDENAKDQAYDNESNTKSCPHENSNNEADGEEKKESLKNKLEERFNYSYPYEHLINIPARLTVSKLSPDVLDTLKWDENRKLYIHDSFGSLIGDDNPDIKNELSDRIDVDENIKEFVPAIPNFMLSSEAASSAERGTATHVFMQFCDFRRLYDTDPEAELKFLSDKGFLSVGMSKLVNLDEIELFRKSVLFERILKAKKVYREFRFNYPMPAVKLTSDPEFGELLRKNKTDVVIQGVVDCLFIDENDRYVLVDYKTDRISYKEKNDRILAEKKLRERHSRQLKYYRDICGEIFCGEIKEVYIYSTCLGDTVDVFPKNKDAVVT